MMETENKKTEEEKDILILAIESSCDETAASVVKNGREVLSNVISSQIALHTQFGGVVPEIASRKHIEKINQVVTQALEDAKVTLDDVDAIGVTYGPGLVGALLVGVAEAKAIAFAAKKPLVGVHHIEGHVSANYIENPDLEPPFVCLIVSGGHTHLVIVKDYGEFEIIGRTMDDAAGEAFDKVARAVGLGYPGGPIIDKLARQGNPKAFTFSKPHIPGLDYSFSGLKTSFLYSLRDWMKDDPDFIEHHKVDLAASLEATVVGILMDKLRKAAKEYKIKEVAVAGGVSANNGLRNSFREHAEKYGWNIFIPKFSYTTDNAAMIAITGYFKYLDKDFCSIDLPAYSRVTL